MSLKTYKYDLSQILKPDDFVHVEKILIAHGLPKTVFRSMGYIGKVSHICNSQLIGFLPEINHLQIRWKAHGPHAPLIYNCTQRDRAITFVPQLDRSPNQRLWTREIAKLWGKKTDQYCFTTTIGNVETMLADKLCEIRFPKLNYMGETMPEESTAEFLPDQVQQYSVGNYLNASMPNETYKEVLRTYNIAMTGRKAKLLEKVCTLLTELYLKRKSEYDAYFKKQRFIRVPGAFRSFCVQFDVGDGSLLENTLLAMYILKHMRSNTILEASHENNTFDLKSLAQSLLNNEISLDGNFLKVE